MLYSPTKRADSETYTDVLELLNFALTAYTRTGDETLVPEIDRLNKWSERLKNNIASKDYTDDDRRKQRVDELLNENI